MNDGAKTSLRLLALGVVSIAIVVGGAMGLDMH